MAALMYPDQSPTLVLEAAYKPEGSATWSSPIPIGSYISDGFAFSALAVDAEQNGTAVWEAGGGSTSVIDAAISTNTTITNAPATKTTRPPRRSHSHRPRPADVPL
jgi:hypothetical protein